MPLAYDATCRRRTTLELYHSRNLLIAKGRLLQRRRLRTPPRTSIEVLAELFIACNHADLNTVQLRSRLRLVLTPAVLRTTSGQLNISNASHRPGSDLRT